MFACCPSFFSLAQRHSCVGRRSGEHGTASCSVHACLGLGWPRVTGWCGRDAPIPEKRKKEFYSGWGGGVRRAWWPCVDAQPGVCGPSHPSVGHTSGRPPDGQSHWIVRLLPLPLPALGHQPETPSGISISISAY